MSNIRLRMRRRRGETKNGRYTHYDVIERTLGVIGTLWVSRYWAEFWPVRRRLSLDRWGYPDSVHVRGRGDALTVADLERWVTYGSTRMGPPRRAPRR